VPGPWGSIIAVSLSAIGTTTVRTGKKNWMDSLFCNWKESEMKVVKFLVVALTVLCMSSAASAITQVWWTAVGNNANSVAAPNGPGGTLNLTCIVPAPGTRCEWTVSVLMNAPAADAAIAGWANDYSSPNAPKLEIKSHISTTTPFNFNVQNGQPGQPGTGALWTGASAGSLSGVEGANILLATFVLSKDKPTLPVPPGQPWAVFTSIGEQAYGCFGTDPSGGLECDANFGFAPAVQFGSNPPLPGFEIGTPLPLPVITGINVIPEPATLSLVGLGILGLLRRRR
jgi:hypothetical protein